MAPKKKNVNTENTDATEVQTEQTEHAAPLVDDGTSLLASLKGMSSEQIVGDPNLTLGALCTRGFAPLLLAEILGLVTTAQVAQSRKRGPRQTKHIFDLDAIGVDVNKSGAVMLTNTVSAGVCISLDVEQVLKLRRDLDVACAKLHTLEGLRIENADDIEKVRAFAASLGVALPETFVTGAYVGEKRKPKADGNDVSANVG